MSLIVNQNSEQTPLMIPGDQQAEITVTDAAARKVHALIQEEGNPALKLRVYITGGGCSGFQYGFTFDEAIGPDDKMVIKRVGEDDVYFLVDHLSYQYLQGSEIDYSEGVTGAQFIIRNPNAQTTCGCGSSFSV